MVGESSQSVPVLPVSVPLAHRLTLVLAGAGWGKSTLLRRWSAEVPSIVVAAPAAPWSPASIAAAIVAGLRRVRPGVVVQPSALHGNGDPVALAEVVGAAANDVVSVPTLLVLDDADVAANSPLAAFLTALVDHVPADLHVVVGARRAVGLRPGRLRAFAGVALVGPGDLAITEAGAEALAPDPAARDVLLGLVRATKGWPVVVRFAAEVLARGDSFDTVADLADHLLDDSRALFEYLAEELLDQQPAECREVLALAAWMPALSVGLLEALGRGDLARAFAEVCVDGAFVEPVPRPAGSGRGVHGIAKEWRATLLGAAFLRRVSARPSQAVVCAAATALRRMAPAAACELVVTHQDPDAAALVCVADTAFDMVPPQLVLDALAVAQRAGHHPDLAEMRGDAEFRAGSWGAAIESYRAARIGEAATSSRLCRKLAVVHYLRGEFADALAACRAATVDAAPSADDALLLAWHASVSWTTGDVATCRELSAAAERAAAVAADDRAIACALTVKAMLAAVDGDRRSNAALYRRALDHAIRAGDALQVARIRSNLGSHFTEEGQYEQAVLELDQAIDVAERAGMDMFAALAHANRGEAQTALGRLETAVSDLRRARTLWDRIESDLVSYALSNLGDVHLLRGQLVEAGAAFRRALDLAEHSGDVQGRAAALIGLSRAELTRSPAVALDLAQRAAAVDHPLSRPHAELACGWAQLHLDDSDLARKHAVVARELGAVNADRVALAESLLLEAAAVGGHGAAALAAESRAIWHELANPVGEARALAMMARAASGARRTTWLQEADDLLHAAGASGVAQRLRGDVGEAGVVRVTVLGTFAVSRNGEAIGFGEWGSRKARDLFRHLVARGGRAVSRGELADDLWPDEPGDMGRRLAVLASTVRAVLDPGKQHPADWYVGGDDRALWVVDDHVDIDAVRLVDRLADGRRALGAGDIARAERMITSALALYRGDAFADDPYRAWTEAMRTRCRTAVVDASHELAAEAMAHGRFADAASLALRVVEVDQFDELAHRRLIEALQRQGRHGEARRAYRVYAERMEELGIVTTPFVDIAARSVPRS